MAAKFTNRDRLNRKFSVMKILTKEEVKRELHRGGLLIEGDAVASIQEQTPGGRIYRSRGRKGALHQAAPAGSAPNADTGELHTSLTTATRDGGDTITTETGANSPHAIPLELGNRGHGPWPFMSPAFRRNVNIIERNLQAAYRRAVRRAAKG